MKRSVATLAATGLLWAGAALPQGDGKPDLAQGERIAKQVCAACHGADGNSAAAVNPKLAGQFAQYLQKQLHNFKAQGGRKALRENPIMAGMVAALTDEDVTAVASYYAAQTLKPAAASDKDLAAQGQKIWRGGIASRKNGFFGCGF